MYMDRFSHTDALDVRTPREDEIEPLVGLAARHFARLEPVARAVCRSPEQIVPMVESAVRISMRDGLTLIGVSDNDIAGFVVCNRADRLDEIELGTSPEVVSIFTMLSILENEFHSRNELPLEQVAQVLMVGVLQGTSRRRQGGNLLIRMMAHMRRQLVARNITRVYSQATSSQSQKFIRRYSVQEWKRIYYDTYECPVLGGRPFASVGGHCALGVLDL